MKINVCFLKKSMEVFSKHSRFLGFLIFLFQLEKNHIRFGNLKKYIFFRFFSIVSIEDIYTNLQFEKRMVFLEKEIHHILQNCSLNPAFYSTFLIVKPS